MSNLPASGSITSSQTARKLNPITMSNIDDLSNHLVGIHDSQAKRFEVRSLFNTLANVIKHSAHIGHFVDLKRPKTVEIIEDKEPQLNVMPPYRTLKQIACEMTCCKPFDQSVATETIADEIVVGILTKLQNKTWDAKAVIALAAFALDYGESWRLSLVQDTKADLLELHVFNIGGQEIEAFGDFKSLVEPAVKLIEGIIDLEQFVAEKSHIIAEVTNSRKKDYREVYTYWAIMALVAASSGAYEWDPTFKSSVAKKLAGYLNYLIADLDYYNKLKAEFDDYEWRKRVFRHPSGIHDLLKALIFPRDVPLLDIYEGTSEIRVPSEELMAKNLLLFISGLESIEDEISLLNPIHDAFKRDKDKQNYRILWVPVVHQWRDNVEMIEYDNYRKKMRWYAVRYFSLVKGYKLLQQEWLYMDMPIIVVVNRQGEIIHLNAMHMIFVWGIQAFPFRPEDETKLAENNNWFWNEMKKVHPPIADWIKKDTHIFIYGGTDPVVAQRFGYLLEEIKKDPVVIKSADASIEHFNMGNLLQAVASNFWRSISHSLLSKITTKAPYELDKVFDTLTLNSMQSEKGWAILSKGENVLVLDYHPLMTSVLEEFPMWRQDVHDLKNFANAFMNYYRIKHPQVQRHCNTVELNHIRSRIPLNLPCPDPYCDLTMDTEVVNFRCCHGRKNENLVNIITEDLST